MGKRSDFPRRKNDFYPTPKRAVEPLIPHLMEMGIRSYCEPCAGDGALIDILDGYGFECARARDIDPKRDDIEKKDALTTLTGNIDAFITNPPWTREILHPLIEHLSNQHLTFLLFDSDWLQTKQSGPFYNRLRRVIPVGRVKWIPDSKHTGKENCSWYVFGRPQHGCLPLHYPPLADSRKKAAA